MNLKTEREKRGLLQQTVAKAMGIKQPQHYSRIENGPRQPTQQQAASFRMAMMLYDCGKWPELVTGNVQ